MRIIKYLFHIIGFLFTILASAFQLAFTLALNILSIFIMLIVKSA